MGRAYHLDDDLKAKEMPREIVRHVSHRQHRVHCARDDQGTEVL